MFVKQRKIRNLFHALGFLSVWALSLYTVPSVAQEKLEQKETGELDRFSVLLNLYDKNESAVAYYKHCLSRFEDANDQFMGNMQTISAMLAVELAQKYPEKNQKEVERELMRRAAYWQSHYDREYRGMERIKRCRTRGAIFAQRHYNVFGTIKPEMLTRCLVPCCDG